MKLSCLFFASVVASTTGCSLLAKYDDQTYKSLTSLRGEVKVFMDDCKKNGASGDKALSTIEGFRVKIAQAYEYEAGKEYNSDTISQMKILENTFNDVYDRFPIKKLDSGRCVARASGESPSVTDGCLTSGYCSGKNSVLDSAFDIAISTEALKNK